ARLGRVVNPAPEVTAVGHVAVLALPALTCEAAHLPLAVRVLQRLAGQRGRLRAELMAPTAECRREKRRRARDPAVRERLHRPAVGERAIPSRRPKALVAAHVTARAGQGLAMQGGVEGWAGDAAGWRAHMRQKH